MRHAATRVSRASALCASALLALVLVLLTSAPAYAEGFYGGSVWPESVRSMWQPRDVARALDGLVFVADSQAGRIAIYDSTGTFVGQFDGTDAPLGQELVTPAGVAVGPDANIYVADRGADRISVFTPEGVFVRAWGASGSLAGQFHGPSDITFDASGLIYVADQYNDRVQVFDAGGTHVRTIGSVGYANGQFNRPDGLSVHANELYVADTVNKRVQVFTLGGVYLRQWGWTIGSVAAPSYSRYGAPVGVLAGSWGAYVSDAGRPSEPAPDRASVVESCSSAGVLAGTYGSLGAGVGQMDQPAGMMLDPSSVLFVADLNNDRLARFDTVSATWLPSWMHDGSADAEELWDPTAVALDLDSSLWVADSGNGRIQHYAASGEHLESLATTYTLADPGGLELSSDGSEIYVTETAADRLSVFSRDGTLLRQFGGTGTAEGNLDGPCGLALAPNGDVVVADSGNSRIQRFTSAGTHLQTIGAFGSAPGQMRNPQGVAFDPAGNLYVADTENNRIQVFDSLGAFVRTIGAVGSSTGLFRSPAGVAWDPAANRLVVADPGNFRIQILEGDGTFVTAFGERGASAGEFRSLRDMVVTQGGTIFASDTGNDRIQRFFYDAAPPTTQAVGVPPGWVNRPVTVRLDAADIGSGVAGTYYRIGEGPDTLYAGPFEVGTDGETLIRFWSVDRTGNIESPRMTSVRIDTTPPSGTMSVAGPSVIATTSVEVLSNVTDAVFMRLSGGAGWSDRFGYSTRTPLTLSGEGTRTVTAQYFDSVDNTLTLTSEVLVDLTGPSVQLTGAPGSGIATAPVTLTVQAADALTSVAATYVSVDGAPEQLLVGTTLVVSGEGSHTVRARAVDAVGNRGSSTEVAFSIDTIAPQGTMSVMGGAHIVGATWLTITNSVTGATQMRFDLGSGFSAWQPYSGFYENEGAGEGRHVIRGQFKDSSGNVLELTHELHTDLSPPVVDVVGLPESGVTSSAVSVSFEVTDTPAGVLALRYVLDGAQERDYTGPFTVVSEGPHSIEYRAIDTVGNETEPVVASFTIDRPPPSGTISLAEGASSVATSVVSLDAAVTGATQMRVDVDGVPGVFVPFAARSVVTFATGDGTHGVEVTFRSEDGEETRLSEYVVIDTTGPSVALLGVPDVVVAGPVSVSMEASDALSAVAIVRYSLDGGAEQPYAGPVTVGTDGVHTFAYRVVDTLGNESRGQAEFSIESNLPSGTLTIAGGAGTVATLAVPVRSDVSGAQDMRFDLGAGAGGWVPFSRDATVTLLGEGTQTVVAEYRSAGGLIATLTAGVRVDVTGPTVGSVTGRVTRLRRVSQGGWRHDLGMDWTVKDSGAVDSGVSSYLFQSGSTTVLDSPHMSLRAVPAGTKDVYVGGVDGMGNMGAWTRFRFGLGSVIAPTVPRETTAGVRFLVSGRPIKAARGETVVLRCYRRLQDGTFALERTFPTRRAVFGSTPGVTARPSLTRGVWVLAFERSTARSVGMGSPSSQVVVR